MTRNVNGKSTGRNLEVSWKKFLEATQTPTTRNKIRGEPIGATVPAEN